jgi:hypothetical protein
MNLKSLLIGGVFGIAATLLGVSAAKADCSAGSYEAARADAAEGNRRGDRCEVIELQNGTFEAQCDYEAFGDLSAVCEAWVEGASESGLYPILTDEQWGEQYEACMTIGVHTGAVRQ